MNPHHCWEWQGCTDKAGYGLVRINKKQRFAHRVAYELSVGDIPIGYEVDHTCHNRSCVNPKHLDPVTPDENKRRNLHYKTHCPQGHEYTEENSFFSPKGWRKCRICMRHHKNESMRRKRLGLR